MSILITNIVMSVETLVPDGGMNSMSNIPASYCLSASFVRVSFGGSVEMFGGANPVSDNGKLLDMHKSMILYNSPPTTNGNTVRSQPGLQYVLRCVW